MKTIIRDIDPDFIKRMQTEIHRRRYNNIRAENRDIFSSPIPFVVSPGNSFGHMTIGIDKVYRDRWGVDIESALRMEIARRPLQELLIGETVLLKTGDTDFPGLICAPTKRLIAPIIDPVNVFLATKAALLCALQNKAEALAIPGMGILTGRVPHNIAIDHMLNAYEDVSNVFP